MKKLNATLAAAAIALASCSDNDKAFVPDYELTVEADTTINVTINGDERHQTIDGFASSDAWNMDAVGRHWSDSEKEAIARLLFSQAMPGGQPEGIGLSMWRVNVGGGTAEQGDASGIDKPERRAECFLKADGTYDWTKQAGQQYFMQKAKEYGVADFVLFSNTPPVQFTKNGKGYSNSGKNSNLREEHYADFANFLASVGKHFQGEGYKISFISPVNEPQYNWDGGQEGSGWQNSEVAKIVKQLDGSLTEAGLADTKIMVGEAGAWNYLYETSSGDGRSNVIGSFFDPSSAQYIGSLPHVPQMVCAHSYWLDTSLAQLNDTRSRAAEAAKARSLKLYQTEWSMMSEKYEGISNYGSASYMDLALAMAQVIHTDLAVGNVSSWSYWTSCERERWDQKSRFYLIRLTPQGGDYGDLEQSGTHTASKNLWTLGNYSLFIRPGYVRIGIELPSQANNIMASAYVSPDGGKLVAVYVNSSQKSVKINCEPTVGGKKGTNPRQYTTSATSDLKLQGSEYTTVLPARSVSTIVYELK